MYIKSVEIHGFKTFANKTNIEFGKGVSSVIGPNGCGKSNIVDSIRWVLGEQSAKSLRGGEMLDVISNGNRKRKPSNICDVCIVLNNEDKSLAIDHVEVAIRRRLYRTGESEYQINGEPARLKDIRELFMDTGIGAKTNTVIEQEQLTKLLSASSRERKVMIEEAAGISRFRQRRQESSLKLERVKDNMTRLGDIVSEVERQKRSVSKQASKAVRFETMQKDLRKSRLDLAVMELHGWVGDRMKHEKRRDELKAQAEAMRNQEAQQQEELEKLEGEEIQLEEVMARLQEEQASFFQEYAEVESSLKDHTTRVEVLEKDIGTLEGEILRFEEELKVARQKESGSAPDQGQETGSNEIETLDEEIRQLRTKLAEVENDLENKRNALSKSQNWEIEMIRQRSQLQNEAIKVESQIEHLQRRLQQVVEKETELEQMDPETANQGIDPETQRLFDEADSTKKELAGRIVTIRHQLKELESALRQAVSETSGRRSRLSLLKEMEEKFEGVGAGVRNVLDVYAKQFPDDLYPGGVHGVVADLVTVPEEYVEAMEAALGPRMQNLVLSTANEAKDAIHFLRKNNFGRATMLPLDRIHPRQKLQGQVLSYPGVKGEAYNLVGFDPQYNRLFSHLLNGTLVVDTLEHGLAISKDHRVRIVTLDGDLIAPEGAMTGGGKGKDSGLLSRKVEIEELEAALANSEREQRERMEQHESLLNREDKTQRQHDIAEGNLKDIEDKIRMAEQKKAVEEQEIIRVRQEKVIVRREKEMLTEQIAAAKGDLEKRQQAMNDLENAPRESAESITKEDLAAIETERNRIGATLQERELKRVTLLERSQSALREREYLLEKIAELEERTEKRRRIIHERSIELDERRVKVEEFKERFSKLENEKNTSQGKFFEMKTQREQLRARRGELQKQGQALSENLRKAEHELTEIAVAEERLRVKQEELFNRIHGEFHVNIEDVYFNMRQNDDPLFHDTSLFPEKVKELRANITDLDNKLSTMGNVNFEAIEELKALEDREGELKGQMGDLTGSFKKLDDHIKELDATCNKMFLETFEQVNEHFTMMFRRLFGGGQGRLIIEQDVDPLLAGITISASPPGKSPKVLTQLSGGEKVLTTIAFLFSIFLYRPSPFCILDEIDAPLDEHNVDRLMDAVRSFTDRCQFLIVTHNRRTMSLSDVIHGVTMQETGVSNCMTVEVDNLNFKGSEVVSVDPS